ncbi:hypothetical protein DMC61_07095 [Amycolatopsis sp. WAC 04169]|nr:hypothetical protein DMC61_07095 [Amycolatopsis sp. WAC 04169]
MKASLRDSGSLKEAFTDWAQARRERRRNSRDQGRDSRDWRPHSCVPPLITRVPPSITRGRPIGPGGREEPREGAGSVRSPAANLPHLED